MKAKLLGTTLLACAFPTQAQSGESEKPHLVLDIEAGNVEHAGSHVRPTAKIITFRNGRAVSATMAELVSKFQGCRYAGIGPAANTFEREDVIKFNCGDDYDYLIRTGEVFEDISEIVYSADAFAPAPPVPPRSSQ